MSLTSLLIPPFNPSTGAERTICKEKLSFNGSTSATQEVEKSFPYLATWGKVLAFC